MWWNFYSQFARQSEHALGGESRAAEPSSKMNRRRSDDAHVEAMVQQISEDIAQLADEEREAVKADLAYHAREWCMKDISHDLRTPLNAIIGFTQMMESGTLGPVGNSQYLEYLRHIRESGYELLDKFEDLMDATHDEHQHKPPASLRKEPIRMKEAIA